MRNSWYDMIYLLTAIGLTPGGSCTVHIYTQTIQNDTKQIIHRTTQIWNSASRAPSLQVIPWHLPYNWGKSTETPQSWVYDGKPDEKNLLDRERERDLWVGGKITRDVVDLFNVAKDRRMAGRWLYLRFLTKRGFSLPPSPPLTAIPPHRSVSPPHYFFIFIFLVCCMQIVGSKYWYSADSLSVI
jgi:hypothetical protein